MIDQRALPERAGCTVEVYASRECRPTDGRGPRVSDRARLEIFGRSADRPIKLVSRATPVLR
jgi:hypothetical protein